MLTYEIKREHFMYTIRVKLPSVQHKQLVRYWNQQHQQQQQQRAGLPLRMPRVLWLRCTSNLTGKNLS